MFYRKNVPVWERAVRAIVGLSLLAGGLLAFKGAPLGWVLAALGLVALVTGGIGYCPMCAMVGRKPVATPGDGPK